jgi:hypothetical protein
VKVILFSLQKGISQSKIDSTASSYLELYEIAAGIGNTFSYFFLLLEILCFWAVKESFQIG